MLARRKGTLSGLLLALVVGSALQSGPAQALNKQAERTASDGEAGKLGHFNLSGNLFFGVFLFNPTYAARPDNSGIAQLRYGLHLDVDLYDRWLTVSYDLNSFSDGSSASPGPFVPTEHDHIVGLLSTIPLPRHLDLTLAVHYESDQPGFGPTAAFRQRHPDCTVAPGPGCFDASYSQSYVDVYARLTWTHPRISLFGAIGGFLYNPTYAARPDNTGFALLRYVLHGELVLLPWLVLRLDLNFFTDREEFPLQPTELDLTSEIAVKWRRFELRFVGEADLPIGTHPAGPIAPVFAPNVKQVYLAALLSWSFDVRDWLAKRKSRR